MKIPSIITKHLSQAAITGLTLAAGPLHADELLFLDTFNRPNSSTADGTGLNESADGKSGSLGALTWTGITAMLDANNIVDINNNRLRMDAINTNGANGGFAYLSDHNFIDASIKSAGTFTVSLDLVSTSSGGDGRVIGFGVGASLAELSAVNSASPNSNPADVFFIYDNIGANRGLRVYHNGAPQGTVLIAFPEGTPSPPDTLSGTFTFADMDVGTTLEYELFIDGISVITGSTTWSGTDENYLSLGSNHSNPSFFDNFSVTIPGPPILISTNPADGAIDIQPSQTLLATFDEPVFLNTAGSITIRNLTTSTNTVISLSETDPDGTASVSGNNLAIEPTSDIGVAGDEIAIEISADAIKDADDFFFAGILSTDDINWSFTIDNIPPAPLYFHPIPESDSAPLDGALFIAFDQEPIIGTGNLVIHQADGTPVETIDVTSANVIAEGNRIAIVPTTPLDFGSAYYVLIDSTAFYDDLGNGYGITDSSVWTFTTISDDPTILFGDSFNRLDGNDLNATTRGKYGPLGALNYTQKSFGPANVGNVELTSGQLLLESNENDGTAGALVYPQHNFTDAAITSAGGFSVTVDLNANLSGGGRYLSVALGRSTADIDGQTSATAFGNADSSDLVVALRNNDTLWIYENGIHVTTPDGLIDPPNTPTKMRIDCSLPDFNSGSTATYSVFFDDSVTAFASGSFTWSGTNENFISLSSNLILTSAPGERHALFDNLQVRSLGGSAPAGFLSWQNANATSGGLDQDHDGDGVHNGIEYFLFGDTDSTGFTNLPGVTDDGGVLSVAWTKAATGYSGAYNTDFVVETSDSLELDSWETATVSATPGTPDTVHLDGDRVIYTFAKETKNFVRLKVTGP